MSERLLAARFTIPGIPDGFVDRPRLAEQLRSGTEGPLTLVSAPAGTGKTVAVSAWATSTNVPGHVVWISLDGSDMSAVWSLVIGGLQRSGVAVKGRAGGSIGDSADRELLLELATEIAAHPEPVVLVLDCDAPLPKAHAVGLDQLLRFAGDRLRLVLLSRSDPMLPLHRYRLAASVVEIRMADLAFTAAEVAELLARKGVELPPATLEVVTRRTRGWVAGLILAAMSLVHRPDPELAAAQLTGDTGAVAEYLLAEVLDAQSTAARDLLLSTSVVDVLHPGLVEALAGPGASRALSFLAHGNAFLDEISAGCYRYHPLFRDLLRAQLSYESPDRALQLRRQAGRWMAEHGLLAQGVRQAVAGEAWQDAARYVVEDLAVGQLLVEHPAAPFAEALAHLPADVEGAFAALVRAAQALVGRDVDLCARELSDAQRWLGEQGSADTPGAELAVNLLLLVRARKTGDVPAALEAAAAIDRLTDRLDAERLAAHPEIPAIIGSCRGSALLLDGQLDAASDAFEAGARQEQRPGCEWPVIDCLGHLALLGAWDGQLRKSADLAARAIKAAAEAGMSDSSGLAAAQTALAWVHAETYDISRARQHVSRAEQSVGPTGDAMQTAMLAIVDSRVRRAAGDLDGALAVLVDARSQHALPSWLTDVLRVEQATVDVRSGEPERAAAAVEELAASGSPEATRVLVQARLARGEHPIARPATPATQSSSLAVRVDGWLVEARCRLSRGDEPEAARALDRSLRLAAPERLRRPFREARSDVRRLLRYRADLASQHGWLGPDLAGARVTVPGQRGAPRQEREQRAAALVVQPLTEKEQEVLGHLAELLTTEEIAAAMFVSVNTVRTHVRNILRKLSASRRNEAVRRARDLGIIPNPPTVSTPTRRESVTLPG